jgi:hypothetical protein
MCSAIGLENERFSVHTGFMRWGEEGECVQVGSVETFERQLEAAQASFGWPPEEYVPVIYRSAPSFSSALSEHHITAIFTSQVTCILCRHNSIHI